MIATLLNSKKERLIFISYNHESSKDIAAEFAQKLRKEGFNVWFDKDENLPSDELSKNIEQGIGDSSIVICFISNKYIHAKNCRLEFFHAYYVNKKRFFLITEKLDLTGYTGFGLHLKNDFLRLDLYKIKSENLVDEIYKQWESRLKNEYDNKSEVMPLNVWIRVITRQWLLHFAVLNVYVL